MIRKILAELAGLFIDDGRFAAALAAWAVIMRLSLPHLAAHRALSGALLFAGFAAILMESALRRARSSK